MRNLKSFKPLITGLFLLSCGKNTVTRIESASVNPATQVAPVGVNSVSASAGDCPNGGNTLIVFLDDNRDGFFQVTETVLSQNNICNGLNGVNGTNGTNGTSAGIVVEAADLASCPAGGSIFKTFTDVNQNTFLDVGENIQSVTTLCNGVAGSNGVSANLSVTAATPSQCPSGGVVYTSGLAGQSHPDQTVVCNGVNGADAEFIMGSVGPSVPNKSYTACHHDYLYIPDSQNGSRGWLTFRHQSNGASDQGIGATGFQIWNVDIANFSLASEVGGVTYCNFNWDPIAKVLQFTVVDNSDGLAGTQGSLHF